SREARSGNARPFEGRAGCGELIVMGHAATSWSRRKMLCESLPGGHGFVADRWKRGKRLADPAHDLNAGNVDGAVLNRSSGEREGPDAGRVRHRVEICS